MTGTLLHYLLNKRPVCLALMAYLAWAVPVSAQPSVLVQPSVPAPQSPALDFSMTAKLAHQLISDQQLSLLGDGSQLVSLYYFGQNKATSVVGLERVGDDYLPIRWLLIFNEKQLLGWYYPIGEFPARFDNGHLIFPRGALAEDVNLFPLPPAVIIIEDIQIPFITPDTESLIEQTTSRP
jgi:hypothetical protein